MAIPPFELTDQDGEPFRTESLRGKIWVVGFAFTSCVSACPLLTSQMVNLQRRLESQKDRVHFLTLTVEPEVDTPERLRAFAERYHANLDNWTFLTGEPAHVHEVVTESFKVPIGERTELAEGYDILHSAHLMVIDQAGSLRGVYPSNDLDQLEAVIDDLSSL